LDFAKFYKNLDNLILGSFKINSEIDNKIIEKHIFTSEDKIKWWGEGYKFMAKQLIEAAKK